MVTQKVFGKTLQGEEVILFSITNAKGMQADVMNYGAILVNLLVPDEEGKLADVVLGCDTLEPYFENGSFFGTTVGPNANRIAGAAFVIDGISYQIPRNENANNLHSDMELGFHKKLWAATHGEQEVVFTISVPDGEIGFPGNREISMTYALSEEGELILTYHGTSDRNTVLNLTNHSYFNLQGQEGDIHQHELWMKASHYTPIVAGAIPTGEIASVKGTVFDFLTAKTIEQDIHKQEEQLLLVRGYDHNWVVDDYDGSVQLIAKVYEPNSKRTMEVYTDLPGVQLYAGNCIGPHLGKQGIPYGPRKGLCLETQVFPNSINQEGFPNTVFGPEKEYHTVTIYKFL